MTMFEHEGQEYEELRAREEACQERVGALEAALRQFLTWYRDDYHREPPLGEVVKQAEAALGGTP